MILSHLLTLYSDIKKRWNGFSLLWWWWHIYVHHIMLPKKHIAIWWKEVKYKTLDVVRGEDLFLLPLRKSSHGMWMFLVYMRWDEGGGGRAKFQISTVYCVYHSRTRIYILSLYVQNAKLKWKILFLFFIPLISVTYMYNGDGRGGYCSLKKFIYVVRTHDESIFPSVQDFFPSELKLLPLLLAWW